MDRQLQTVLNMLPQPAFLLREGALLWCNAAASALRLEELHISTVLGQNDTLLHLDTADSSAQLAITIRGERYQASVRLWDDAQLFIASPLPGAASERGYTVLSDSLRRPLQSLISAAGTLFEEFPEERSPQLMGAAAEVNRSIYQLQRLCGQLSEGGRLLEKDTDAARRSCCLTDILDSFVNSCRALVTAAGYILDYFPMDTQIFADVDAPLLERALYNLLANAIAYTPKGSTIHLHCEKQERLFLIHMEDSGEGIHPEVLPALFSCSGNPEPRDPRSGLGLGLPMARRIAELHGGSLTVCTAPGGKGTRVSFCLSLARAPLSFKSVRVHCDSYGGRHHGLVELSEVLPSRLYDPEEIES